jgi:hypothetical protein
MVDEEEVDDRVFLDIFPPTLGFRILDTLRNRYKEKRQLMDVS